MKLNLGKMIKNAREKKGLTQEALGALAGVSRGYAVYIESGERFPGRPVAIKLAEILEIDQQEAIKYLAKDKMLAKIRSIIPNVSTEEIIALLKEDIAGNQPAVEKQVSFEHRDIMKEIDDAIDKFVEETVDQLRAILTQQK